MVRGNRCDHPPTIQPVVDRQQWYRCFASHGVGKPIAVHVATKFGMIVLRRVRGGDWCRAGTDAPVRRRRPIRAGI